jgi:hypothetical protein
MSNECKSLEWMIAEIKTMEVNISNDDIPKKEKIGDYWSKPLAKRLSRYIFNGLVVEMGEMKI